MTDAYATEDGSVGIYRYVVFQNRVTRYIHRTTGFIIFKVLCAECHTLIQNDMTADDGGFANDDASSVVNAEMVSDLCGRMDVYTGATVCQFG